MAHYYLGLIFLIRHDYENARAAFQNSLFNLQDYAKKDDQEHIQEVQSNFALGYYGLGFCYLRLGNVDLARQNFQLAVKMDPSIQPVVTQTGDPSTNALLFIDAGQGPMRAGRGWYNEESAFGPTPAEAGPVPPVVAWVDGQQATMAAGGPAVAPGVYVPGGPAPVGPVYHSPYALVDTLAMAQQKRWQDIDTIRKTKAVVGTGLMAGGTGVAAYGAQKRDQGMMWAGIGAALLGGAVTASSQADLRYWEMLPRTVYVVPLTLPPGEHDIVVQAGPGRSAPVHVTIPGGAGPTGTSGGPRDTVLYFRLP